MSEKLGDMLLQAKLISKDQLASALDYQKAIGVKLNFIREDKLATFLSEQQKLPIVQLKDHKTPPEVMKLVPKDFAEKHEMLAYSRDGDTLTIVTPDPTDYPAVDELAFMTGLKIQTVLATRTEVTKALQGYYYGGDKHAGVAARRAQRGSAPVTDTPVSKAPATAPVQAASSGAAAKRGRAAHVGGSLTVDQAGPLEAKPINVNPDKLARALAGLLMEKDIISLGELMDRVAREP